MFDTLTLIIIVYFIIMNIAGYASMGIDKAKAKRHAWRIPEATLFSIAILGGSVGSIFGMFHFRHKTKHWYFWVVNLLGLAWQIALPVLAYLFLF